jgi:3-oxoacyl-[acyl-carrier-protein] synthase-3
MSVTELADQLLDRIHRVRQELGSPPVAANAQSRLGDLLDSMALVELVVRLAEDCGVAPEAIEESVQRRFSTVQELAQGLHAAGLDPIRGHASAPAAAPDKDPGGFPTARTESRPTVLGSCWLGPMVARLPVPVQDAEDINRLLGRPPGWLQEHAGIERRCLWGNEDPIAAAAGAAMESLGQAGLGPGDIGALLATSEAPPMLAGLAAALHHRLGLPTHTPALEVGAACTGYLAAVWLGRSLLSRLRSVLVVAVEAPGALLKVEPGPAGEAAALFGDAAAACLLAREPTSGAAVPLTDIVVGADGGSGHLLQAKRRESGDIEVEFNGIVLAGRAVRVMAQAVRSVLVQRGLRLGDVGAIVCHAGNGRMPALLARQLGIAADRVWGETARTGNLGSASLPVAWALKGPVAGPVAWTAVGAGLTWGAALTG